MVLTITLVLLYFGQSLFVPMCFGLLIAMVLYPVCKWLEERIQNRTLAISICLAILIIVFAALLLLLIWQLNLFRRDLPGIIHKITPLITLLQNALQERLSIPPDTQQEWLHSILVNISGNAAQFLKNTLNTTASTLFALFLIPIYTALFLYHRNTFVRFLHKIINKKYKITLDTILKETINTYYNYIKGMLLVYIIVGVLNSIGLLALGIEHAVLFGMLTAFMTIIPYIGIIVSAALPVSLAFIATDSLWYPIGVITVFSFVQYLEANVIFPKVVGTQLNVSTWATLVAIIAGGIIWGVSGMILFIPFAAILKIVTDHVRDLEALNILLKR